MNLTVEMALRLQRFHEAMTNKLILRGPEKQLRNKLPVEALFKLLRAELIELEVALEYEDTEAALGEMVDVANFAFLMYHRLRSAQNIGLQAHEHVGNVENLPTGTPHAGNHPPVDDHKDDPTGERR